MKFDFPFKKKKKKENGQRVSTELTQIFFEDTHEIYAHLHFIKYKKKTNEGNSSWLNYLCCITISRA